MITILLAATMALQAEDLAAATKKAAEMTSYAFKIDVKADGKRIRPVNVEGKYEKDKPVALKVSGTEAYRKTGGVIVVKDGEGWKRLGKPAKGEKPGKGEVSAQTVSAIKIPHDELGEFEKNFEKVEKSADGDVTVYSGALTPEGARSLASTGAKAEGKANLTYSGTAKAWVNKDGALIKYEIAVKAKGTLKDKEIEQSLTRTVQISDMGATKVEVPEAAAKALEGQS